MGVALGMALVAAKPYKHFAWNLAQVLASASNLTTTWGGSSLVFDPTQGSLTGGHFWGRCGHFCGPCAHFCGPCGHF